MDGLLEICVNRYIHSGIREVRAGVSICQIIFSASFRLIAIGVYGVHVYYSIIGLSS